MLVVVKQPHTDGFKIEGTIPSDFLIQVENTFGKKNVSFVKEKDDKDELVNFRDTDWFKEIDSQKTPGGNMKFYRNLNHLTQAQLAKKMGTSKQAVSQMENNKRPISGKTAKELARILGTTVSRFIF